MQPILQYGAFVVSRTPFCDLQNRCIAANASKAKENLVGGSGIEPDDRCSLSDRSPEFISLRRTPVLPPIFFILNYYNFNVNIYYLPLCAIFSR